MSQFFGGISGARLLSSQPRGEIISDEAGFLPYCSFVLPGALLVPGAMFVQKSMVSMVRGGPGTDLNFAQVSAEETQWQYSMNGVDDDGQCFINFETVYFVNTGDELSASYYAAALVPTEGNPFKYLTGGGDELLFVSGIDLAIETQIEIADPSLDNSLQLIFSTLAYFPPA